MLIHSLVYFQGMALLKLQIDIVAQATNPISAIGKENTGVRT